jgi:NADPH:quinone reductase-like Zn-dependent oxidoreductase
MAIVRTSTIAINPADAKMLDFSAAPGAIHGYDFAGTVVALGADALASGRLAVGDRVAGFVHGMNSLKPDIGAFAQYVGAYADILLRIPKNMRSEDAATLGVGLGTAALGLFRELRVPASVKQLRQAAKRPVDHDSRPQAGKFVLVVGGSTATGTRALQLLKL